MIDTIFPEDSNIIDADKCHKMSVNLTAVQVSAYINKLNYNIERDLVWIVLPLQSEFSSWVYFTHLNRFRACRADLLAPVLRVRLDPGGPGTA